MPPTTKPQPPSVTPPPPELAALHQRVQEALASLPFYFRTDTTIAGIDATDIFNLSAALGAAIENQVVGTLNAMRDVWDPDDEYPLYGFVRQAQTFPDVLLRRLGPTVAGPEVLLGIELKGWYLLSKEGVPSFRYAVTPEACAPQDLLVVVPWALTNVIGGSPRAFTPYVESARYAAEARNHHWQHVRRTKSDTTIEAPADVTTYPKKSDAISDRPASDGGGNFGRFARTGLMDEFIDSSFDQLLSGIQARHWLAFFKAFQDKSDAETVRTALGQLRAAVQSNEGGDETGLAALKAALRDFVSE